ncbi:Uncharacterized protein CK203_084503 [Vitis vinifera]|uniref:DUF455 domain-containing protein n=1 Tax=Vitis vinifera TaxID=29760 RepID=A0A438EGF8_VITVI|nr:Uncharacterized protein CK203_084503 [Vitis vinifera]
MESLLPWECYDWNPGPVDERAEAMTIQLLKLRPMLSTTLRCAGALHYSHPLASGQSPCRRRLLLLLLCTTLHGRGLQSWRENPLNKNWLWGPNGPEPLPPSPCTPLEVCEGPMALASSLAGMGSLVLSTSDPLTKSKLSHLAYSRWRTEHLPIGTPKRPIGLLALPNPSWFLFSFSKPLLVSPKEIPAPKNSGLPLNAYMLHNLAHVELNAIDLAWDTVVRFSPYSKILGEGFFADFARVADDESRHFAWCSQRLAELGFNYGDMPAHNLLWRECAKSSNNVAARLVAIPLVQVNACFALKFPIAILSQNKASG